MLFHRFALATFTALLLASPAGARNTVLRIPLADVLALPEAQGKLDPSVRLYLAGQSTPKVLKRFSTDVSNPKTNGFGKSDEFGCKWAALTAMIRLQESAKREGGNAVIDIVSYYNRTEYKSTTHFECHAGAFVIGVAFRGTYAKIAD